MTEQKTKKKIKHKKLLIILGIVVLLYAVIEIFLPAGEAGDGAFIFKGERYVIRENRWAPISKGIIIGKYKSLLNEQIYSIKNDTKNIFIWCQPTISEFGGMTYQREGFVFPELHEIEPTRIVIGWYSEFYKIRNKIYAYTEDSKVIDEFYEIVNEGAVYDAEYSEEEMKMMENVCMESGIISLLTDQVPGGAYNLYSLNFENGKCILEATKDEKYDITHIIYKILTEGEIVDQDILSK